MGRTNVSSVTREGKETSVSFAVTQQTEVAATTQGKA